MPSNSAAGIAATLCAWLDSFLSTPMSASVGLELKTGSVVAPVSFGLPPVASPTVAFCSTSNSPRRRSARMRISAASISSWRFRDWCCPVAIWKRHRAAGASGGVWDGIGAGHAVRGSLGPQRATGHDLSGRPARAKVHHTQAVSTPWRHGGALYVEHLAAEGRLIACRLVAVPRGAVRSCGALGEGRKGH